MRGRDGEKKWERMTCYSSSSESIVEGGARLLMPGNCKRDRRESAEEAGTCSSAKEKLPAGALGN
jgi:hypothetical protein